MAETFFHVDRSRSLSEGMELECGWPPHHTDRLSSHPHTSDNSSLRDRYPEGLSKHGGMYAASSIEFSTHSGINDFERIVKAKFYGKDPKGGIEERFPSVASTYREHLFEAYRIGNYPAERSRFQSFFAMKSVEEVKAFNEQYCKNKGTFVLVECDAYDVRDMNLITRFHGFGEGIENAEKYWTGKPGSNAPTWEVVMHPPVKIREVLGSTDELD